MVKEFSEAAVKLEPGQISDPVKSQFGWHIIKLEGKRTKPLPVFDDVKDQIGNYLIQKAQQAFLLSLREKAKIVELDKPPASPAAPASGATPAPAPASPATPQK
jgi:peptidyl-prolyl cis-trans isomerase C